MKKFTAAACLLFLGTSIIAGEIALPKPNLKSGKPFMQCVAERRTERKFSTRPLSQQTIAEILFVADGVTRKDGRKTVPTARNKQNQSVYAVTADGIYLYNSKKHSLIPVMKGDFRKNCGLQPFHKKAPLILLFVADLSAVGNTPADQAIYAGNHSGSASQNVYLYAASENLATVVCGMLDRAALKKMLNLKKDQMVVFSQPIAYPAK
jgi:nitroreductase